MTIKYGFVLFDLIEASIVRETPKVFEGLNKEKLEGLYKERALE